MPASPLPLLHTNTAGGMGPQAPLHANGSGGTTTAQPPLHYHQGGDCHQPPLHATTDGWWGHHCIPLGIRWVGPLRGVGGWGRDHHPLHATTAEYGWDPPLPLYASGGGSSPPCKVGIPHCSHCPPHHHFMPLIHHFWVGGVPPLQEVGHHHPSVLPLL